MSCVSGREESREERIVGSGRGTEREKEREREGAREGKERLEVVVGREWRRIQAIPKHKNRCSVVSPTWLKLLKNP